MSATASMTWSPTRPSTPTSRRPSQPPRLSSSSAGPRYVDDDAVCLTNDGHCHRGMRIFARLVSLQTTAARAPRKLTGNRLAVHSSQRATSRRLTQRSKWRRIARTSTSTVGLSRRGTLRKNSEIRNNHGCDYDDDNRNLGSGVLGRPFTARF